MSVEVAPVEKVSSPGALLRALRIEVKYEQISYWRNFRAAFFTFLFPLIFLCIIGLGQRNTKITLGGHPHVPFGILIIPGVIGFSLTQACYTNLAIVLSIRRQTGQLMRRRATPVPPSMLIGGMIGSSLVIALILLVITTIFGMTIFHIGFPHHVQYLALALVLGATCFCSLGILIQSLVKDADSAPPIINLPMVILAFMSGSFIAVSNGSITHRIASYFPLQHLNNILRAAYSPGSLFTVHGSDVLNLVIWTVVAVRIGSRRFQWAPVAN